MLSWSRFRLGTQVGISSWYYHAVRTSLSTLHEWAFTLLATTSGCMVATCLSPESGSFPGVVSLTMAVPLLFKLDHASLDIGSTTKLNSRPPLRVQHRIISTKSIYGYIQLLQIPEATGTWRSAGRGSPQASPRSQHQIDCREPRSSRRPAHSVSMPFPF